MSEASVATVVVVASPNPPLTVAPGTVGVAKGATVQFSASEPVTWSVQEGAAGGTITPEGLYTAPMTAGTFHVVATEADDVDPPIPPATPGWENVTPSNVTMDPNVSGNYGANVISRHPARPSDLYASICNQGVFKSTDFGKTWHGPINTGTNGQVIQSGAGSLAVAEAGPSNPPLIYANNLRGSKQGIWKSVDGGVNWTACAPMPSNQDVYPPVIDPHDANHVLVPYHEQNLMAETVDGGQTWRLVPLNPAMNQNGGSGGVWFVESSDPAATRRTWLWQAQGAGGGIGIWRTTDSGASWVQVEKFEKPHGGASPWQKGNGEIIYGGPYGSKGWGTYRSTDYGQTWALVDIAQNSWYVATSRAVYSQYSWSAGVLEPANPNFRGAPMPGTSGWRSIPTPPASGSWTSNPPSMTGMSNGWGSAVVVNDGTNYIIVGAHRNGGIWRYVEDLPTIERRAPDYAVAVVVVSGLEVQPSETTVETGRQVQFSTNAAGPVTWSIQEGAAGGTITPTGLYTAPSTPGTYHVVATLGSAPPPTGDLPPLTVVGSKLVDPTGKSVILRGPSSMGMGMVYGDKSNPGTYLPMSVAEYVQRAVQTDANGNAWHSTAIRLCFERFPCVNPDRLYADENMPYAMPETVPVQPWQPGADYSAFGIASAGGKRWRVVPKKWMADRGQPWNPTPYQVGDVTVNLEANVYRCTSSTGTGVPKGDWGAYPKGTGQAIHEDQGALQYVWQYLGPFGRAGTVPLDQLTAVADQQRHWLVDNLATWQYATPDYSQAQAEANFADWKAKVMDPAIAAGIAARMYVVVCDFDFGPAHHPLRGARMQDFWTRMAQSQWANHPQVIFELWNESEDIAKYGGGPGSWASQKPALQAMVNAIRNAGAQNVIIVPPPFYSAWVGEATASPLTGTNLAYAWHQYRDQWEAYSSNRGQFTAGAASGQAVISTEWGDGTNFGTDPAKCWPTATTVPPPLRGLFEPSEGAAHPVAGWFAWSLSQNWGPPLFQDNALTQPNPFGEATRRWLHDMQADSQPTPASEAGEHCHPERSAG